MTVRKPFGPTLYASTWPLLLLMYRNLEFGVITTRVGLSSVVMFDCPETGVKDPVEVLTLNPLRFGGEFKLFGTYKFTCPKSMLLPARSRPTPARADPWLSLR